MSILASTRTTLIDEKLTMKYQGFFPCNILLFAECLGAWKNSKILFRDDIGIVLCLVEVIKKLIIFRVHLRQLDLFGVCLVLIYCPRYSRVCYADWSM